VSEVPFIVANRSHYQKFRLGWINLNSEFRMTNRGNDSVYEARTG